MKGFRISDYKNGFTLIELLGVLIILAVISMITFPAIDDLISGGREESYNRTVESIITAAKNYGSLVGLGYPAEKQAIYVTDIQKKGLLDSEIINPITEEEMNGCVWYYWDAEFNQYRFEYDGECETSDPTISIVYNEKLINSNGWAKENVGVTFIGNGEITYCISNSECEPTELIENNSNTKFVVNEGTNYICANTKNTVGTSETLCKSIKLDKTAPTIDGITPLTVNRFDNVDIKKGVTANDTLSGLAGEYTVSPSSIDTSTAGMKTVTYKVSDIAGNTTTINRTISVQNEIPSVLFTVENSPFNSNNWAKENVTVRIDVTDNSGLGIKEIKYCKGTSECVPTTNINNGGNVILEESSATNKICVEAIDNNNTVNKVCSNNYQIDKVLPNIEGVGDLIVNKGGELDLSKNVTYSDALSGIDGSLTITPSSLDTTIIGTKQVVYSIKDKAGNVREITRNIIIDADAPNITFSLVDSSAINSNGWAKNDFYVKANITDNSGSGIKEVKSCTTNSSSECSPVLVANEASKTYLITTEGSNRACIEVTDNNNKTIKACSDTYKLDKTAPVAGTADFTGTMGSNSWYTSNVTVNKVNGSDALSGHLSTTSNATSITSNTTGITITITTTDLAGNAASRNYTIKVDKNAPKILAKSGEITITEGDSNSVSNYFVINYSTSGGSVSCTPDSTSSLSIGMQKLICNVTGGNGKTATAEKEILVNEFCTTPITVTIGGKTISTTECEIQREDPVSAPRYVGLNPKNYVRFNNELWRIIGVFDGEIKIIRNEYYVDSTTGKDMFAWNTTDKLAPYWEGTGYYPSDYDCSTNWSKASLKTLLNTTFLNSIDSTSRSYINSSHIWNLGAIEGGIDYSLTFDDVYNMERGTTVHRGMPTTWRGAIALIYPTDLPYASSSRSSDNGIVMINSGMRNHKVNWLYQLITENGAWTLNSRIDLENPTYYWDEIYTYRHTGAISSRWTRGTSYYQGGRQYRYGGVLPTLYLKSNVKIKSGTGTENDPYILGL